MMDGGAVTLAQDGTVPGGDAAPGPLRDLRHRRGSGARHPARRRRRHGRTTSGVDLFLREAGRVTGTVVDGAGAPVPDATVLLRDAQGRVLHQLDATTDHEGAFAIERVPAGTCT